ncbi:hypothetical protein [Pseudoalteromonas phage vB_Pun_Y3]
MKLNELKPGTEFILVRTGGRYRVRQDQSTSTHYSTYCTRVVNGKPLATVYLNNQCLVEIASNDNE